MSYFIPNYSLFLPGRLNHYNYNFYSIVYKYTLDDKKQI